MSGMCRTTTLPAQRSGVRYRAPLTRGSPTRCPGKRPGDPAASDAISECARSVPRRPRPSRAPSKRRSKTLRRTYGWCPRTRARYHSTGWPLEASSKCRSSALAIVSTHVAHGASARTELPIRTTCGLALVTSRARRTRRSAPPVSQPLDGGSEVPRAPELRRSSHLGDAGADASPTTDSAQGHTPSSPRQGRWRSRTGRMREP
jgi:hypothetical protein